MYRVNQKKLKAVAQKYKLDLIVAFGSQVKGRAVAGRSDLDVAGRFECGARRDYQREVYLVSELAEALTSQSELDFAILNGAGPLFIFEIARTGVVLYQKTPTTFAQFRLYASRLYEDHQKFFAARERYMKARYG